MGKKIEFSIYTKALLNTLSEIEKKNKPPSSEIPKIKVSQTVSFFAFIYEKIRNAVEFREEHLIRRAAIERILKRRLMLNPQGKGEGENLIRELLWARYLPNETLTESDVIKVQHILDKYLLLQKLTITGRSLEERKYLSEFILHLLSCEIEEQLNWVNSKINSAFLHFFYQVLKEKIFLKEVSSQLKDSYFYVACESGFAKNDLAYIRFHLFSLLYKPLKEFKKEEIEKLAVNFLQISKKIDSLIDNPFSEHLKRFVRRQVPPFLILFTIIRRYFSKIEKILSDEEELSKEVDLICREKYQEIGKRLRQAGIRSVIYIFLTKMIFALILEYPLSLYFYNEVDYQSLAINSLFPPFLMGLIVSFFQVPSEKNTKKIYQRIVEIINKEPTFETEKVTIRKNPQLKRPILLFGFTIFYSLTFAITFSLIYLVLDALGFNLISKLIFVFFVSMITFFGYRVRQISKEYTLEEKESILSPIFDFFFVPILSVGKFLSSEIAKLNIFIILFDFLIEAPFKLMFEIVEEWINFVRARKEEIV